MVNRQPGGRGNARTVVDQAIARAAPALLASTVALIGALDPFALPTGATPVRIGAVILLLAIGIGVTVLMDRPGPRPYWQMALLATLILMPIVTLQAAASRVPFVAIGRGSAGPLLWLTLATAVALLGLWLFAAHQSNDAPQDGSLVFLPAALLVPAILGAPGSLDETSALMMLGEAFLVAGVAIVLGLLAPGSWRPPAGAVALGTQFALLWTLGRGPVLGPDGGAVVPLSAVFLLALTALLTVLTPLAALFSRRFFQTVEEESGGQRPARAPARGARRDDDGDG
jgi:hypothetical protein